MHNKYSNNQIDQENNKMYGVGYLGIIVNKIHNYWHELSNETTDYYVVYCVL